MSMIEDMAKHFDSRLHQLVLDTFDTCQSGGVSTKDTAHMLVSILLAETTLGMVTIGLTEEQSIGFVTRAHRELTKVINQRKRKPRARAGT
jgi:hypothetical protein